MEGVVTMKFLDGISNTRKEELLRHLRAIWTHDSTAIEGNALSLGDTMFVLSYGLTVKGKPLKDQIDVQNHATALDAFFGMVERGCLAEDDLFQLHRLVINEQSRDIYKPVGAYKREDNGTYHLVEGKSAYHSYLPADEVPGAMKKWLEDFNASLHVDSNEDAVIDAYVQAHMGISSIHPFYDGNGRIARLVANLPVLVAGFPPIVIPMERRQDYSDAIRASEQNGDTAAFRELVRASWQTTIDLVREAKNNIV